MCPRSASSPSETSMAALAIPRRARPSATLGCGRCSAARQAASKGSARAVRPCRCARPSAARPGRPDIQIESPGLAPSRRKACPAGVSPRMVTQKARGPRVVSPPIRSTPKRVAQPKKPRANPSIQSADASGKASASVAQRGCAPIAAMSETFTARVFQPSASGSVSARKCVPSTNRSVDTTSSCPGVGTTSAPSSPTPSTVWRVGRLKK